MSKDLSEAPRSHCVSTMANAATHSKKKPDKDKPDKSVAVDLTDAQIGSTACGSCMKQVADGDDGVECELCGLWYHCRCQSMSELMYKAVKQFSGLHWYCKGCQGGAEKLLGILSKMQTKVDRLEEELVRLRNDTKKSIDVAVAQLRSELQQVDTRVMKCETGTEECRKNHQGNAGDGIGADGTKWTPLWSDIVAKEVNTAVAGVTSDMACLQQQTQTLLADRQEQEEINKRKNCAIIHGLKEAVTGTIDEIRKADCDQVSELLHELQCDSVSVNSVIRLGKKMDDPSAKPRPVKIILAAEHQKDKLIKESKNLRTTSSRFSGVFAHQDLTRHQRERRHQLLEEMRRRQEQGEPNLILVNWKIVTRRTR